MRGESIMIEKVYVIPIQNDCNCNCQFCISKVRNYQKESSIMKADINFLTCLELIKKLEVKKIEITGGGEPTLNDNLQSIIDLFKIHLPKSYIKLYTNGRLEMPLHNLDEINISIADINDINNKEIMGYKDTKKLLDIIKFYRSLTPKLRLSIPIIKGAIDNEQKMKTLVDKTQKYIDEYVVRTLYDGTYDISSWYADFNIADPRVIMEKDNCLCDFNNKLIMWSDNRLYTNWDLNDEYVLIKKKVTK
jgi:molybdenum cofactor biosynthesis enzyme MoaA